MSRGGKRCADPGCPTGARDLSNTQYAALGLWTAQKYKIDVPAKAWRTLARATMRYAQKSKWVKAPVTGEHTTRNGGKLEVAGFGYRKGQKATGSMTTAGVSILQICKIGLGAKLSGNRRTMDRAIEGGVNWLGQNFAVDKNPGHNGWPYYYLYGLERVGSLLRIEQMGEHWWYLEGARHLLDKQTKEGHWPGGGQERETRTAFALLFLRRATAGKAATTGLAKQSAAPKHLFVAGEAEKHDVAVGASGQQPLSIWVTGFGDALASGPQPLDLGPVMVRSPYVVYADCPLSRAYRLFVTMGLRHLVVVSHEDNSVAGVVTRADLASCLQ